GSARGSRASSRRRCTGTSISSPRSRPSTSLPGTRAPRPLKAVVLAAGYATRLRPLTDSIPKMLLPLAERPMLDYLLERIRDLDDIEGIHLVTNSRFAPAFTDWAPSDVTVHDDGTTSNEDRLGAIGDLAFVVEQAGLA